MPKEHFAKVRKTHIESWPLLLHAEKITYRIRGSFPAGAFVKLGSRSPKDSWVGYEHGSCCHDGQKAILLFNDSERISDDLHMAQYNEYLPFIVVHEWVRMPAWAEFRGFIKNGKLVGLSQYNYLSKKPYPEIAKSADLIEQSIRQKVERIADLLPVQDVIADFLCVAPPGSKKAETILIELNPFHVFTDPCLFNWKKDNFNQFQFRYMKNNSAQLKSCL